MIVDNESKALLRHIVDLFSDLPNGVIASIVDSGIVVQAHNRAAAQQIRSCFPGLFWRKLSPDVTKLSWWEEEAYSKGVRINIYAIQEAPPSCKAIEEEYEEEEKVPTAFETRMVTKTRTRWECPE